MLLPTPSEPLTAPTLITPGVNACGEIYTARCGHWKER